MNKMPSMALIPEWMEAGVKHRMLGRKRRAVAPIIATLLMVAIAVVGGIIVFVFAQGFFSEQQITAPAIESLEIFGFDARDVTELIGHNGTQLGGANPANNAKLGDADAFAVYVRNRSAGPVAIDVIQVFGAEFVLDTGTTAVSTSAPAEDKYSIVGGGKLRSGSSIIGAGQEVTIVVRYNNDINGDIKIGRPIPVKLFTAGGSTFLKQLTNGLKLGG